MSVQGNNLFYGTFTATGNPVTLEFPTDVTYFEMHNLTQYNSTANPGVVKRAWYVGTQPDGSYFAVKNTNSAATDTSIYATSGGFTPFDSSDLPIYPAVTVTSVSQAADASVVANGHGLIVGDIVRFFNITNMQQLSGWDFSVKAVSDANTFTIELNTSGFAAAGAGGMLRKIASEGMYFPQKKFVFSISQAANAVVQTSYPHGLQAGDTIFLRVPASYGMVELNQQRASVVSVTDAFTFVIDINTTGYTAFAFPTSAVAAAGVSLPNFSVSGTTAASSLNDASDNQGFRGLVLGSAVCGAASDVIHWVASRGVLISQ